MSASALHLRVAGDGYRIAREAPTQRILEIEITAPASSAAKDERPALNLTLVIDRSGSMSGGKLAYVKRTVINLLDLLKPTDRLGLVIYDDEVETLSKNEFLTSRHRLFLGEQIRRITSGGMTNLAGGWLTGCERVAEAASDNAINRVLLLTDGLANVGMTDPEELAHHAAQLAQRGVSTSTFGVGEDFNEHLLERMATQGDGNFYYIDSPENTQKIFEQEFGELLTITAKNLALQMTLPKEVTFKVFGGWRLYEEQGGYRLALGNLAAGRSLRLYVQLQFPPAGNETALAMSFKVHAASWDDRPLESAAGLTFYYASQAEVVADPINRGVMERYARVRLADVSLEALALERDGRYEEASRLLTGVYRELAKYLPAEERSHYEHLIQRMSHGMQAMERKVLARGANLLRRSREDLFDK
ncbi:vWA domain-containing protein [Thermanaerothrix daxensis]|uniref:vWA domain-containing protein n=1 Tax=Thermanaerothrix daxensis TaxID=869279 RepID=UPI0006C91710|nr:VWA domain-containing protein [Thermanaerothrix daxensis]